MVPYLPLCSFDGLGKHVLTSFHLQNCVFLTLNFFFKDSDLRRRSIFSSLHLFEVSWMTSRPSVTCLFLTRFMELQRPRDRIFGSGLPFFIYLFFTTIQPATRSLRLSQVGWNATWGRRSQFWQKLKTCQISWRCRLDLLPKMIQRKLFQIPQTATRHRVTTQPRGVFPIFLILSDPQVDFWSCADFCSS